MDTSLALRPLARDVRASFREHRRSLLAFHIYFAILAFCALSPTAAWLLAGVLELSGASLVGNEDLLRFLITPAGMLWLLLSGTFAAVAIYLEHAGLILVACQDQEDRFHTAGTALRRVGRRLPRLLGLAGLQVAAHLVVAAPFLGLLAGAYVWLLGQYDIYYVLNGRPREFWSFLGIAVAILTGMLLANGSLYARWCLSLPALALEEKSPLAALKRSASLTRGARPRIAMTVVAAALLMAALPALLSYSFDAAGSFLLPHSPDRFGLLAGMMALLLFAYAVLALAVTFIGASVNSLLILNLYNRRSARRPLLPRKDEPRRTGLLAVGIEGVVALLALAQLLYAAQALDSDRPIANCAHRGSSLAAPENTLAAIDLAIREGADYVELDVRQSADGRLVLLHDRDLLRIAGDRRPVWRIPYRELRRMDAGAWFDPAFAGQRIPNLDEAIDLIDGRARLYLEIKTSRETPALTRRVVDTLIRRELLDQTIVASLNPNVLLEAKRLEPSLRVSLLVHTSIGSLEAQPFDIFALRDALVTPARIRRIRQSGAEVHVWTVNDRQAMARYIDLGVDAIITDRPDLLAATLEEWESLSRAERLLVRLRNWIW